MLRASADAIAFRHAEPEERLTRQDLIYTFLHAMRTEEQLAAKFGRIAKRMK